MVQCWQAVRNFQNLRYFSVSGLKDWKVDKSKPTWKLKHANSILEYFEYFCQMSSKSILIILSYTVSNLAHFFWDTVYLSKQVLHVYFELPVHLSTIQDLHFPVLSRTKLSLQSLQDLKNARKTPELPRMCRTLATGKTRRWKQTKNYLSFRKRNRILKIRFNVLNIIQRHFTWTAQHSLKDRHHTTEWWYPATWLAVNCIQEAQYFWESHCRIVSAWLATTQEYTNTWNVSIFIISVTSLNLQTYKRAFRFYRAMH